MMYECRVPRRGEFLVICDTRQEGALDFLRVTQYFYTVAAVFSRHNKKAKLPSSVDDTLPGEVLCRSVFHRDI